MTLAEVATITKKSIVMRDSGFVRGTHVIRTSNTDVWLFFEDDKLQWLQVHYVVGLKRMESHPKKLLCER
jgi:hypothetical protein